MGEILKFMPVSVLLQFLPMILVKVGAMLKGKDGGGHIGDYVEKTKTFIDGLRRAHDAGEPVLFH